MTRLWRYWPVRVAVSIPAALVPVFVGFLAGGFFSAGFGDWAGGGIAALAVLVGAVAVFAGWKAATSRLDRAARGQPPASLPMAQQVRTLAALSLPVALLAAGVILLNVLSPVMGPFKLLELTVFAILAVIPPFLFVLQARPRNRRHWQALGLCIPAIYATNLATPFAAVFAGQALFTSDPGTAVVVAWFALFCIALNAPFAALLVKSGACALGVEATKDAEAEARA